MTKSDPNVIDILGMELEGSLPHWLSPSQRIDRTAIRAKHRAAHFAKVKPASDDTMAALAAAYEAAKKADPVYTAALEAEATRREAESGFSARAGEKLQIVAWAKAIMVLDSSEVLVRDLIERELAGAGLMPIGRAIRTTNALVNKIGAIRETAIKTAFRILRERIGDKPILDRTLATWASAFAKDDLASIRQAIQTGLATGIDSTEIARKVVGTMGLNGVDGITEMTRHKIAHLGVVAVRASRK